MSLNFDLHLQQQVLIDLLHQQLKGVQLIYLFGSFATNQATAMSDLDIAIQCDKPLDPIQRWEVEQTLAIHFNLNIDLVDLLSASTVMQQQILETGQLLWTDGSAHFAFEMKVMRMYQELQVMRRDILAALK